MADHLPFDERPFRLRMGLRPLDLDEWLEVDGERDEQLALKRELVSTRFGEVVAIVDRPGVREACEELWDLVSAELSRENLVRISHSSARFAPDFSPVAGDRAGTGERDLHPIVRAGLATQEDWAVMVPVDGQLVLAAACVCFPTRWVLSTKIGKPMSGVHEHVAYYDEHLSRPVDSFFDRLTVERPVWRLNWNLVDDPALFQPVSSHQSPIAADDAGERILLRVERQTLRRLPRTGAIVFGIRIHQRPVATLAKQDLAVMRVALANLPAPTFDYKGLGAFADQLDRWITTRLGL